MDSKGKIVGVIAGVLAVGLLAAPAQAYERGRGRQHPSYHVNEHYPASGKIVVHLPNTVISVGIGGHRYHYSDGVFYRKHPRYYVVVPPPREVVVVAGRDRPSRDTNGIGETFTVNIPDDCGGYTPVTLKRSGRGFIGPQGEFYPEFPKVEQLKVMYVKAK